MNVPKDVVDNFRPDWTGICELSRFEQEYGFRLNRGAGWYNKRNDWMLILPRPDDEVFVRVMVWNDRDPREAYKWVADVIELHLVV